MSDKKRVRAWPAVVILLLGAAWVSWAWLFADAIRQMRVFQTYGAILVTSLGLLLWLLFFSRLPWRRRFGVLGVGALALLAAGSLLRVRGVTGDFLPVLDWRWAKSEPPALPPAAPPAAAASSDAATDAGAPAGATDAAPLSSPAGAEGPAIVRAESAEAAPPTAEAAGASDAPSSHRASVPAWPQFQGPSRDGTLPGPVLARDFAAHPPRLVWRQPIGVAWSSFAVAEGLAVTQEQRGDDELVVAYDLETGAPRWSHADRARYETVIAGVGPRATPTLADGRVHALGATGILNALDLATGRRLWSRQVVDESGAKLPEWGKSCSPLVTGGKVIVSAGGSAERSLVAYDAATGAEVWSAGTGGSSYSSPVLVTLRGMPQIVIFNRASLAGHDASTGRLLWEHPWPREQPNVATPVALPGDRLLFSSGYGIGSKALAFGAEQDGRWTPRFEWESPRLKSKFANMVLHGGHVYGLDDGVLTCLDPQSGERRWKGGRYGHGQVLLVAGVLLVQSEEGEIVLVEPSPEAHRELTRFQALDGKTWNPPVLVGSRLLVRNDREAALYELAEAR